MANPWATVKPVGGFYTARALSQASWNERRNFSGTVSRG
jgi:hypothetical protein